MMYRFKVCYCLLYVFSKKVVFGHCWLEEATNTSAEMIVRQALDVHHEEAIILGVRAYLETEEEWLHVTRKEA